MLAISSNSTHVRYTLCTVQVMITNIEELLLLARTHTLTGWFCHHCRWQTPASLGGQPDPTTPPQCGPGREEEGGGTERGGREGSKGKGGGRGGRGKKGRGSGRREEEREGAERI